jgi:putative selenate reductase molybdopterin-binding subunit
MPEIEIFLIQTMEASGPFGAKAVAEIGMDSIAPAVRAALLNATGVRMFQLPFTPERVWRALNETSA